ncbi:hypothetical protein ZYGR_0AD00650 [Zygosaccharomyces rouxii]|uniref:FAD-binding FR-type domain-containing protein n=1 Tax=Zygosaccharomyces rouxii TaxID=4956 RepID=A0A1Q3A5A2_ZYGRO|nr:hypothetical protein ZYGR_0AD00650 [Zygosaccharomyces rouxii]
MMVLLSAMVFMWSISAALSLQHSAWERVSVLSCAINLTQIPWDFESEPGFYNKLCDYEPAFGSWSHCIHEQLLDVANESTFVKSLDYINQLCSLVDGDDRHGVTLEKYYSSLHNASHYMRPVPSDPKFKAWYPVEIDSATRRRLNSAYYSFLINLDNSDKYALWLIWYFIIIMGVAALLMIPGVKPWLFKFTTVNKIRGDFILPTLTQTHAAYLPYKWATGLVPTKFESLLVLGFFLLHGFLLFYNYKIDPYNMIFKSHQLQWLRQVADRSGILSFAHFPLIVVFSTRNSILEHLTGFKYTTSIVLHKWVGRSMVIDAFIHGIAYILYAQETESIESLSQQDFWKIGVLAAYVAIFLCIFSMGFLRRSYYETFLYLHIVLALFFFYCCWAHVKRFGWEKWIHVSIAFWILERLLRLKSILRFGIASAKLELVGPDLFKVLVPRPANWSCQPAQYVFLYFLQPACICWQSHPFTFIDLGQEVLIVIRAKQGATQRVLTDLIHKGGRSQLKVLIEGPYGASSPLPRFQDTLLLCGGSGVPGPLAYALNMAQPLASAPQRQNLHIVIVNRGVDILEAYMDPILRLKHLNVDLQIHITGSQTKQLTSGTPQQYGSTAVANPGWGSASKIQNLQEVISSARIHYGRPNVSEVIANIAGESRSLAICCCGPPAFVDLTRNYVAETIGTSVRNNRRNNNSSMIEYFEEYQTW